MVMVPEFKDGRPLISTRTRKPYLCSTGSCNKDCEDIQFGSSPIPHPLAGSTISLHIPAWVYDDFTSTEVCGDILDDLPSDVVLDWVTGAETDYAGTTYYGLWRGFHQFDWHDFPETNCGGGPDVPGYTLYQRLFFELFFACTGFFCNHDDGNFTTTCLHLSIQNNVSDDGVDWTEIDPITGLPVPRIDPGSGSTTAAGAYLGECNHFLIPKEWVWGNGTLAPIETGGGFVSIRHRSNCGVCRVKPDGDAGLVYIEGSLTL